MSDYRGGGRGDGGAGMVNVVYILYLVNLVIPFAGLVGLIMAYVNQDGADDWVRTHYRFQIRTFWIGLLYVVVGSILTLVLIGWLIIIFYIVWLIVRCVKGMSALGRQDPVNNPGSWMFG